ncbi:MAG: thiamine pyrophosphate-binding protein, partial [Nitrososphaerales archaeon]
VTSPTGKGSIPEDHPLALGVVGSYGRRAVNEVVKDVDLVFFAASRAGDLTTDHYVTPRRGVRAVQLDINPSEVGRIYPVEVALVGDAKVTLAKMAAAAKPAGSGVSPWLRSAQERVATWCAETEPKMQSDAAPIRPERLCRELTEALPANAVLVADTGHSSIWTSTLVSLNKPGQRFIRCMGTLGWALPGAIGAKCALPDRPVVCFAGDGALFYHLSELETAARHGIDVVVVVHNNSAFGQEKGLIAMLGEAGALGAEKEIYAFRPVNFASIAEEMGCLGIRVEKPGEIKAALAQALAANRPVLVDVVTDIDAMPAWS